MNTFLSVGCPPSARKKGKDYNKLLFFSSHRVVTKISSFQVNTTSRRGIKRLEISFGSIFLLFSNKSSRGATLLVAGENLRPPALNDNPESYNYDKTVVIRDHNHNQGSRNREGSSRTFLDSTAIDTLLLGCT